MNYELKCSKNQTFEMIYSKINFININHKQYKFYLIFFFFEIKFSFLNLKENDHSFQFQRPAVKE